MHESNLLCHKNGNLLSNAEQMKPIGEIRQLRLQQFITQTGLSYADINGMLGRNRRDATLNQLALAAKNTSTGKPRRMGDVQARMLETTFGLPAGWFDSDPENYPDIIARRPTGQIKVMDLKGMETLISVQEAPAEYQTKSHSWPFEAINPAAIEALSGERRQTLERIILAYLGQPVAQADWITRAFSMAAELDRRSGGENFTFFVRAIEEEITAGVKPPTEHEVASAKR